MIWAQIRSNVIRYHSSFYVNHIDWICPPSILYPDGGNKFDGMDYGPTGEVRDFLPYLVCWRLAGIEKGSKSQLYEKNQSFLPHVHSFLYGYDSHIQWGFHREYGQFPLVRHGPPIWSIVHATLR